MFTTQQYEDLLLCWDLRPAPARPAPRGFRPAGRLPLVCADADSSHELCVYRAAASSDCP